MVGQRSFVVASKVILPAFKATPISGLAGVRVRRTCPCEWVGRVRRQGLRAEHEEQLPEPFRKDYEAE
jgi:hypothetical protein